MPKFIKVTYGTNWSAHLNISHISMIEKPGSDLGGAIVSMSHSQSSYHVNETVEKIMEMING